MKNVKREPLFERPEIRRPLPPTREVLLERKPIPSPRFVRAYILSRMKDRYKGQRTFDSGVRERVLRKTGGHCYLCWRKYDPEKARILPTHFFAELQIDHIIPVDKFGPNSTVNYLPTCAECNREKSNLSLADYKSGLRKRRDGTTYYRK